LKKNHRKKCGPILCKKISTQWINGENYAETLYKKAVFARAKAELLPEI